MPGKKGKWKLEKKFDCPTCGTKLEVKWKEETITPAVPADKKEIFEVSKDTQTDLDKLIEINKNDHKKKTPGRPKKK